MSNPPPEEEKDPTSASGVKTRLQKISIYKPKVQPGVAPDLPGGIVAPYQPLAGCPLKPASLTLQARIPHTVNYAERQRLAVLRNRMEEELPQLTIENNLITVLTKDEIIEEAVAAIVSSNEEGYGTVNDPRMGTIDSKELCDYCNRDIMGCAGHLGYIKLAERIFHPLFLRMIVSVLQCVCNDCGGLLLSEKDIRAKKIHLLSYERRLTQLEKESTGKACRRKHVDKSGRVFSCATNPKYLPKKLKETGKIIFLTSSKEEKERTLTETRSIFKLISAEDARLMGFENGAHPLRFIIKIFPVIPPCDRVPTYQDGKLRPDQLTVMYMNIVKINNELAELSANREKKENDRKNKYAELVNIISHFIDNTDGTYNEGKSKEYMSIKQRIQGKEGHIRGGMAGKRVNYTARTVIGPDPTLKFGQIRVPKIFARFLTVQVRVRSFNKDLLTDLLRRGQINNIISATGETAGQILPISEKMRETLVLQIGDRVERWLQNGDYVLFNRQPTLHRPSMMGGEVVLGEALTIGLHLSYTTPLNADFDGDESNLHLPQSEEAQAELRELMAARQCILNTQNNKPSMGIVYDGLSGSYLLTQADTWIDSELFQDCLSLMTNQRSIPSLPERMLALEIPYSRKVPLVKAVLKEGSPTLEDYLNLQNPPIGANELRQMTIEEQVRYRNLYNNYLYEREYLKDEPQMIEVRVKNPGAPTYEDFLRSKNIPPFPPALPPIRKGSTPEEVKRWREQSSERSRTIKERTELISRYNREYNETYYSVRLEPATVTQYSGVALFSALLPEDFYYKKGQVVIINGVLTSSGFDSKTGLPTGVITKEHVGTAAGSIIQRLILDENYGIPRAVDFLTDHPFVINRWLTERGLSVGLEDCFPNDKSIREIVQEKINEAIQKSIDILETGGKSNDPVEEERRERQVQNIVDVAKATGQRIAKSKLTRSNNLGIMAISGAKGTELNIGQITGLIGQQSIRNKRMPVGLNGRCTPYDLKGELDPRARGLCENSFMSGLTPKETFFMFAGGREGLLDTALRTANIGYLGNRLRKTAENVYVDNDGSLRDAVGNVIQFSYGEDGFDPTALTRTRLPSGDILSFIDLNSTIDRLNGKFGSFNRVPLATNVELINEVEQEIVYPDEEAEDGHDYDNE